jgi:hypothetical protein
MAPEAWRPLLAGELAARARDAVFAIAESLAELLPPAVMREGSRQGLRQPGLNWGTPGLALLFGYLARGSGSGAERYAELAERNLDEAVTALAMAPTSAGLFDGFTGVAWTAEHLSRLLGIGAIGGRSSGSDREPHDHLDPPGARDPLARPAPLAPSDPPDANTDLDQALLETLAQAPWKGHFDLAIGLAGIGVYASERLPRPTAGRCLAAVVGHLESTAVVAGQGTAWLTRPEMLAPYQRAGEPLGIFDLGVAHGVPGVISVLADACRVEPCAAAARRLLDGAVQWLLALPRTARAGFAFGKWVSSRSNAVVPARRLAWCYGDPGIAATLLYAARTAGDAPWEGQALAIAAGAARAPGEGSGIVDAGLCHGAVGLAHIFNRIYQATDEDLFADAARFWYRRGLDMRRPGEGIAGFGAWETSPSAAAGWPGDPGLFTGAAGIGLGLLAAISDLEPRWDRLLRLAIPVARRAA